MLSAWRRERRRARHGKGRAAQKGKRETLKINERTKKRRGRPRETGRKDEREYAGISGMFGSGVESDGSLSGGTDYKTVRRREIKQERAQGGCPWH